MPNVVKQDLVGGKEPKKYNGSKQPMVALGMLNTSKAIRNAFTRIAKRREWMTTREQELRVKFNSQNADDKRAALVEATKLKSANEKLVKVEEALNTKLTEVNTRELEELQDEEFPSIGLTSVQDTNTDK